MIVDLKENVVEAAVADCYCFVVVVVTELLSVANTKRNKVYTAEVIISIHA